MLKFYFHLLLVLDPRSHVLPSSPARSKAANPPVPLSALEKIQTIDTHPNSTTYSSFLSRFFPSAQLQMSECRLNDITQTLDWTSNSLNTERRQKQQIQDQLHHGNEEVERLQQDLTNMRHTTQKKVIGFFLKVFIHILNYEFAQTLLV